MAAWKGGREVSSLLLPENPRCYDEDELLALDPLIRQEARSQLDRLYPVLDREAERRVKQLTYLGIRQMLSRGVAAVTPQGLRFWNPFQGAFVPYDAEYNAALMGLLKSTQPASPGAGAGGLEKLNAKWGLRRRVPAV
jgi:hypothetical protein